MTVLMPQIIAARMKDPENVTEEVIGKMMMERLVTVLTEEQIGQFRMIVDEAKQQSNKLQQERKADKRRYYAYLEVTDQQIEQREEIRWSMLILQTKEFFQKQDLVLNQLTEDIVDRMVKIMSEIMGPGVMTMATNAILIEKEKQQLFLSALLIN